MAFLNKAIANKKTDGELVLLTGDMGIVGSPMVPVRVTATACWIGSTSSSSSGLEVDMIGSWLLTSRPRDPSAD